MIKITKTILTLGLMTLAPLALAQTVVSSFAPATNLAPGVWYEDDVRPGGTASVADLTGIGGDLEDTQPLPVGAALLTTDFTNAAKGEVGVLGDYGMPGDTFSSLTVSYSYFKAANAGQNPASAPSLKLAFSNLLCDDVASAGDCYMELVYEPTWNGPPSPATDTWTAVTIDENEGLFWATGGFGTGNGAGGPPLKTLAGWRASLSEDFGDATLIRVAVGVGSYNQGQIGYFDAVSISHSDGDGLAESYDFDPGPSFESLGECISTLIGDACPTLKGRDRAACNHEQQAICRALFGIDE